MNRLESILFKWNFKKIAIWYIIIAFILGIICVGTVGYIYKERLNFAWHYSQIENAKDSEALKTAVNKTSASSDVIDVLILDDSNSIKYSAKNSEFANSALNLFRLESEKKYLAAEDHPNYVFQYVKSEEFMLNSIVNKDFGKIRFEFDVDSTFEKGLSSKTIYMLSCIDIKGSKSKVYVITAPTSVPGGMRALKASAAVAMLLFCVYWVLIALWLYKDAAKCKLPPLYWGLIGLFTNIVGLIVYKIYKRSMAICPSCGAAQSPDHLYCSSCGTQLGARCESCKSKVGVNDSFCHHCGNKIK